MIRGMSPFTILAEPNRRQILDRLNSGPSSVNDLVATLKMSQPAVSKHLRVLREAGFVKVTPDGQRRLYRIHPKPLEEVYEWLKPYRKFWSDKLDSLEQHLVERNGRTEVERSRKGRT
jgi:DNA-binding transcriptional ArsR family regulator